MTLFSSTLIRVLKIPGSQKQASCERGNLSITNCVHRTLALSRQGFSILGMNLLLIVCLLTFCVKSSAYTDTSNPNQPFRVVLPNGVRLILKPEPEMDRTAVSLFVDMRSDAAPNSAAVGEMVARTLFYGNANRTQNSIQALVGEVGGSLDVLRTRELVAINYVTVPSQLPEALHLVCDCLKYASFAPESLQRAFSAIHEERQSERGTGFTRGYAAVTELLGQAEPTEDLLRRVTQAQARAYFLRQYVPAHTVISIAGNFDAVRVQGLLNAFLADYNRPIAFAPPDAFQPSPHSVQSTTLSLPASGASAYAFVGVPAPSVGSPDYPAFIVLQTLLGGGHASRLFRQAREMLGLGYEVGALYPAERSSTLITYLQWNALRSPQSGSTAIPSDMAGKLLNGELDGILKTPPTEAELNRARNVAIGQDALRHERARDRAFLLGWYETSGLGYAFDTEFPRRVSQVKQEDIVRASKNYLSSRANVTILPSLR